MGAVVVVVALVAVFVVSLAIERRRCSAKTNPELQTMALEAAQHAAAAMGASAIESKPVQARYFSGSGPVRAKFKFKADGGRPRIADVWISNNCNILVGWMLH